MSKAETGTRLAFGADDYARIADSLRSTDDLLSAGYPGDDGSRQPVHTVYVPADTFTPDLGADWGRQALAAVDGQGGLEQLAGQLGLADPGTLAALTAAKLASEPIEDLRLDFEDGYGARPDAEEDAHAVAAGRDVARAVAAGTAPAFIGIRFKSFEAPTRDRGLRTLDLFLSSLLSGPAAGSGPGRESLPGSGLPGPGLPSSGHPGPGLPGPGLPNSGHPGSGLPDGLVLTLPKVSTVAQVEAMAYACGRLEEAHGLPGGRLRFEVQMETPLLILGADGTVPVAQLLHAGSGRISALNYGTYDYSASLGIAAAYQSMEHPAADYAKAVMQVAAAGTGVRLSDGSTNILPVGDPETIQRAWVLHARLVARSLAAGYYQGWDLHPAQLPTRYLATYGFYRSGFDAAAARLNNYVHRLESTILDEPATARALARFIHRGLTCGALTSGEVAEAVGVSPDELAHLAHPQTPNRSGNKQ
ncbi:aldolase [Arthrobacter sp. Sa2CUA1]|uniref:Aldolase n=1 Tax=Arthrobacter gallicola TaxID=2762225 RepID=A0ABR8UWM2_9MICC|nr:aldolase [Arthrobacter gallicola]MBD7996929.1 aldolase [Arthrobacter gallicola]